jgi:hypothetical protein
MFRNAGTLMALCSFLLALSSPAQAAADDDIVGTWTWTLPKPTCQMTRTYRSDGTTTVVNGSKTVNGTYTVKWNKERTGRMLISTITTDDGGTDCDGTKASTVGRRYLAYVFPESAGLLMCLDSSKNGCLGPYRRRQP